MVAVSGWGSNWGGGWWDHEGQKRDTGRGNWLDVDVGLGLYRSGDLENCPIVNPYISCLDVDVFSRL